MFNSLLLLFFLSTWQYYTQNDFGSRAMGFGGTIPSEIIVPEDASLNPAALAYLNNAIISMSVQGDQGEVYSGNKVAFETSEILPSYVGVAFPVKGKYGFSLSVSIPYNEYESTQWIEETTIQHPEGTGRFYRFIWLKRFYAFNTTMAFTIKKKLSIGINLAWLFENSRQAVKYSSGDSLNYDISLSEQFGIEPTIGIEYKINELSAVILNIKKGFTKGHYNAYNISEDKIEIPEEETLPLSLSFGFSARLTRNIVINNSMDYINWERVTYKYNGESNNPDYLRDVFRSHFGLEYRLSTASYRIGIYEDPSSLNTSVKRDQIFLTAGAMYYFGNFSINIALTTSRLIKSQEKKEDNIYLSLIYGKKVK